MITVLQMLLAVGLLWWSGHGLNPVVALALFLFCAAFVDLWREPWPAPPTPRQQCGDCLAELELAERFNRESG